MRIGGPLVDAAKVNYGFALSQLGVQLDHAGDLVGAERLYDMSIAIDPAENRLSNRALLYMRTGRTELAIDGYLEIVKMNPLNAQAHAACGTLCMQLARYEQAAGLLNRAVELAPGELDVRYNLGVAFLKLDHPHQALETFLALQVRNPH